VKRYVGGLKINSLDARVAKCRYESKALHHEYINLHSASKGSKHDSFASVIADLLLGLLQLEKQVRRPDVYFYEMSVGASKHTR